MLIKLSQLEFKPEHRIKAMRKKEFYRIRRLEKILKDSKDFNIPLSTVTVDAIEERIKHHKENQYRINIFWNYKFNENYKGSLGRWANESKKKNIQEEMSKS